MLGHPSANSYNGNTVIGAGTLRRPDAIENADLRALDDEGLAYTFDPAASLQVHVDIPAHGSVEVRFADGYATSEYAAAKLIARYLGTRLPDDDALAGAFAKSRLVLDRHGRDPDSLGYSFSADGTTMVYNRVFREFRTWKRYRGGMAQDARPQLLAVSVDQLAGKEHEALRRVALQGQRRDRAGL